jgi:hypothetical protein
MNRFLVNSLVFAFAWCDPGAVSARAEDASPSGKKIKVFIMSGQSGMAGFGRSHELPDALRTGNDRVLMFEDGKWEPLRPFNLYPDSLRKKFGLTEFSFGPEIAFAHAIAKAWPDETIGIVKQAAGGTGVLAWHPNWTKEQADRTKNAPRGNLFKALTNKVNAACASRDCELVGFVWHQGARDMSFVDVAKEYLPNLQAMVDGVRKEVGAEDMPFVYSSWRTSEANLPDDLSDVVPTEIPGNRPGAMWVLKAQWDAQQAIPNAKMVILRDLEKHPEDQHTDTAGLLELGGIFAEAYLDMSKKPRNQKLKSQPADAVQGKRQASVVDASGVTGGVAPKWKTTGLQQANSMGGGEAAISKSGKFRVFVLMGQSNMTGAARAKELRPPYTEKHDRIRVWANGRWEYFVPSVRFGPGVSMARELADLWPNDTIGIIKVASGGTGIRGFEKNWSFERADRTFDGKKGSLYKDLMHAVAEAKRISKPEFSGFVWKQGAADGTKKDLAEEYYDTLQLLISDLRTDLDAPDLPVFIPSYMNDEELLKAVLPLLSADELRRIRNPAGKPSVKDADLLEAVLTYLSDTNSPKFRKAAGKRPYIATVIAAQNRAGRELPNVTTIYPGELSRIGGGNNHFNAEGQIKLGKIAAATVEEFYKAKE